MNRKCTGTLDIAVSNEPNGGFVDRYHTPTAADASVALQRGDTSQVINLLNFGIHPDSIRTQDTHVPALTVAIANKNASFVKALLDHGANPNIERSNSNSYLAQALLSIFDEVNEQLLLEPSDEDLSVCEDSVSNDLVQNLRPLLTILSYLLEAGADANAPCWLGQDNEQGRPLHETIRKCDEFNKCIMLPIISALLESQPPANPYLTDSAELTNAFDLAHLKATALSHLIEQKLNSCRPFQL